MLVKTIKICRSDFAYTDVGKGREQERKLQSDQDATMINSRTEVRPTTTDDYSAFPALIEPAKFKTPRISWPWPCALSPPVLTRRSARQRVLT